jgi:membrane protein DedA with SNARE-associated domain
MTLLVLVFVAGGLIGLRFNVYAVIPASIIAAGATALTSGGSVFSVAMAAIGVITSLQIGYLIGSSLARAAFVRRHRHSRQQEEFVTRGSPI